jgi:hypothetical protein
MARSERRPGTPALELLGGGGGGGGPESTICVSAFLVLYVLHITEISLESPTYVKTDLHSDSHS